MHGRDTPIWKNGPNRLAHTIPWVGMGTLIVHTTIMLHFKTFGWARDWWGVWEMTWVDVGPRVGETCRCRVEHGTQADGNVFFFFFQIMAFPN
jgi:hypothetical protein